MVWPFFSDDTLTVNDADRGAVEETFECDYERDCSPLYRAIESAIDPSEFEPIVKFLDTGYWPGNFFADGVGPADQAKMWVTRFDPVDPNKVKWSQLPLHLAIVCGAPPSILGRLVKLYPQALRCTDDQHMLPLHLALRHGATDEVVAYLLMQFPDAVNAKGKNGRTAVDCALRAKDKLRGKILELFVEKNKGKKSAGIVKEQQELKADLKARMDEVAFLKADLQALATSFESLKELKTTIETDLLTKIQDVEQAKAENENEAADKIERLQSEKLLESIETQKKFDTLIAAKAELEASEKQARQAEAALRKEVDAIHARVAKSHYPEDWQALKTEVGGLQANRLERSRTETQVQIDTLREELEKTMMDIRKVESYAENVDTKAELQSDLKLIQKTVTKLDKTGTSSKTNEELNALRNEVDSLRTELKERAEASKTRLELTFLKKAMEMELKHSQGKTDEELAALRKAIETANTNKLDNKTNAELTSVKMELELLKREIKNKELINSTQIELDDLCENLATEIETTGSKAHKMELTTMKKTADQLKVHLSKTDSSDGIILVKKTVKRMKEELKKKDATLKIMDDVTALKSVVETELKRSEGKTQEELLQMKKQLKSWNEKDLATKDVDELAQIKSKLADVKTELKEIEKASKIQQELDALKKVLAFEMKNTVVKAEQELASMKKAVDEVNMEQKESKKLKKSLAEEMKVANKQTEQNLLELKKALDSLDVKKLESKNKDGWDAIRTELDSLKAELAVKQSSNDLATELDSIKKTVAGFNLDVIEQKTNSEFKSLREEMDAMRASMKQKDEGEAILQKDIDGLRKGEAAKKKKGLKKFFTRHFALRKNEDDITADEVKAALSPAAGSSPVEGSRSPMAIGRVTSAAESTACDHVSTIAPPSMGKNNNNFAVGAISSEESCSDDETAKSTENLLAKLSVSFNDDAAAPVIETVHTGDSSVQSHPKSPIEKAPSTSAAATKPPLPTPPTFRKSTSMGPRIPSPMSADRVPMKYTFSKPVMEESDDVELEKADTTETTEDEILIKTPVVAAAQ